MIDRLAQALASAGVEVDAVQLAEILWVATRRRPASGSPPVPPAPPEPPSLTDLAAPSPAPAPVSPSPLPAPPMYLLPSRSVVAAADATEVRLPAPVALPGRLRLGRSLHALKRKRPAARRTEFDLDATIELYGNTGLLMPLLRRGTERWFDVTLVVDTGPTMDVWAQTTSELAKLLAGQGTFRRVRRLRLTTTGTPELITDTGRRLHPERLADPEGRQLIMVVTDCVSPAWYGSEVWPAIQEWGRHGPVVLVQPLPQRLWESTALGPTDARLTSYRPAQPNHGLRVTWPWWWLADEDERTDVVPVVALSDTDLARWARMVMGGADSPVAGVLTEPADPEPVSMPALSPVERVAAFKSTVSNEAYQLAVCLAAVPIRLPVARIVQYSMLRTQSLVPLAEVFAGGLLRRVTLAEEDLPPDEIDYDFVDGVREVLQGSLTGSQTLSIFRAVARYLESTIGAGASFMALLAGAEGDGELDPRFRPFAEVSTRLMDRLGLRSRPTPTPTEAVQSTPQPLAPLGWMRAVLVGHDPGIDSFRNWLRTHGSLNESSIVEFRYDHDTGFPPRIPLFAGERIGVVFILAIGDAAAKLAHALASETADAVPTVVLTLNGIAPPRSKRDLSKQRKAFLTCIGPSVFDVIDALSGAAADEAGTTTVSTFYSFMTRRAHSGTGDITRFMNKVVLRPAPEVSVKRRRALVVGVGPGEDGAQLVANRLTALSYSVVKLIGDKSVRDSTVIRAIQSIASTARADDLFWLHVSGPGGGVPASTALIIPRRRARIELASLRTVGARCGGAVVITEVVVSQPGVSGVFTAVPDTELPLPSAKQFVSISSAADSLHPMLLDLLAQTPSASLGELADNFRNDSRFRLHRRGTLTASIAADRGSADPLQSIDLVQIPVGEFYSGLSAAQQAELDRKAKLGRTRNLPTFSISRFPITNAQFAQFTTATNRHYTPSHWQGRTPPEEIADHPVIQVSHGTATAYCKWLAKTTGLPFRLPTALEWEKAARGTDGRKFPWGNEFDPARASHRRRSTVSVHAFSPAGDSPYGVADTVGNVREWTSDAKTHRQPGWTPTKSVVVCGGGMLANKEVQLWCSHQTELSDAPKASIGFRVAFSLES